MNEQRMASGQSQGGIFILARARSIARRENDLFSREICERRTGRQQCACSDDLYTTLSTGYAVDLTARPRAPALRPLLVTRRANHVGGPSRTRPWPPRSC
jgi:hypothetical protein